MKCEKCGRTATSHVTSVMNGKKEEHHYCNECFARVQPFGNIAKGLNLPFIVGDVDQEFYDECDCEDGFNENGVPYEYSCSDDFEECAVPAFLENIVMSFAGEVFEKGIVPQIVKGVAQDAAQKEIPAVYCSGCGLSFEDISKTKKAGCAKCYQTFDNVLVKKHRLFSDGRNYSGKDYSPKLIWSDIDYLQNELNIAVKNQNFELAAQLRDGMKKLQKKANVE